MPDFSKCEAIVKTHYRRIITWSYQNARMNPSLIGVFTLPNADFLRLLLPSLCSRAPSARGVRRFFETAVRLQTTL